MEKFIWPDVFLGRWESTGMNNWKGKTYNPGNLRVSRKSFNIHPGQRFYNATQENEIDLTWMYIIAILIILLSVAYWVGVF